jgi:ubiquinone/menaquinone biosynthesis C-methylase UbiE
MRCLTFVTLMLVFAGSVGCKSPSEPGVEPSTVSNNGSNNNGSNAEPAPDPAPQIFEGREIAQTMSYLGADWLTRPERDAEENTTLLHAELGLAPGDVACDVGAGNGYHTLLMAAAVGPTGQVIASDLQPQMLELLQARAEAAGVSNLRTVQAKLGDPALPVASCDLILLVDVYHEFAQPEQALAVIRAALKDGGRVALVEYREEDPDVPIKPLHKLSKAQILAEYLPRGFELVGQFDGLPWQHLMFFGRAPEAGSP